MPDLYIDGDMLRRVKGNLDRVCDLLGRPVELMADIDGRAMGVGKLEQRMDEFGDEWGYGIGKLEEFSGAAVEALARIEEAFSQADDDLAKALNEAGS